MTAASENNKRIARNTGLLYVRMLLIMLVTLYTSRVVLRVLGVTDFGIYNVVGGVVTMLSFLNSSLNTATQRYLNYEMGKGNTSGLQKVFSMSFICFVGLAVVAVVLAETVGLWFLYNKLVIPPDRLDAAVWVFHFSVLTFVVNLLTVPYNAAIIAHERMSVYAYVSVGEVLARLLSVFVLQAVETDKLWLYGLMMFGVSFLVTFAYRQCCIRLFRECRVRWVWDKTLFKGLFSFSGWMLSGTITYMLGTQGVNMLINMFFGPALNAARAVAVQVYGAVNSFIANFMTAIRPQIVKSYAEGNTGYMYRLVFDASRYSFYLLFILVAPILFNAGFILDLWLEEVPEYAVLFTRLVLLDLLIVASYTPMGYVSQAAGKIRDYQLVISGGFLLNAVLTWVAFSYGLPVSSTFYILLCVDFVGIFARLGVLRRIVSFPVCGYLKAVWLPSLLVFSGVMLLGGLPGVFLDMEDLASVSGYCVWCVAVAALLVYGIGLRKNERETLRRYIYKFIKR